MANANFKQKFLGKCMGVGLEKRGTEDDHVMVTLMVEDDENWHPSMNFSSHWIDEMITQLQLAKSYMETQEKEPNGFGYKFKP